MRSGAAVPMLAGDAMMGVLGVQSRQPGNFDQQDVDVLSLVANQTALGLSKARLLAESSRRWREMTTLYDFSQDIGRALSVDELCERLVRALEHTPGLRERQRSAPGRRRRADGARRWRVGQAGAEPRPARRNRRLRSAAAPGSARRWRALAR